MFVNNNSRFYAYEKYYPQVFLEECKYAKENIKTKNYIEFFNTIKPNSIC